MDLGSLFHPSFVAEPFWPDSERPDPGRNRTTELGASRADFCIVGANGAGAAAAITLAEAGAQVVLIISDHSRMAWRGDAGITAPTLAGALPTSAPLQRFRTAQAHFGNWITELGSPNAGSLKPHYVGAHTADDARALHHLATDKALPKKEQSEVLCVSIEEQWRYIGSAYPHGGIQIANALTINPGRLRDTLYDRCESLGVIVVACPSIKQLERKGSEWKIWLDAESSVASAKIIVTSPTEISGTKHAASELLGHWAGRQPRSQRSGLVTAPIPEGLLDTLLPRNTSYTDTARLRYAARTLPESSQFMFSGLTDPIKYRNPDFLYARLLERFPALRGAQLTHFWTTPVGPGLPSPSQRPGGLEEMDGGWGCNVAECSDLVAQTTIGRHVAVRALGRVSDESAALGLSNPDRFPIASNSWTNRWPWLTQAKARWDHWTDQRTYAPPF